MICTRNRADRLAKSLQSVSAAIRAHPTIASEVIVVDNGSTDQTQVVLRAWAESQSHPVRLVSEPAPGLARARNKALDAARHDVIAMTDDDCEVRTDYLLRLAEAHAAEGKPAVIGGRIELGDPDDLPITIKTDLKKQTYQPGRQPGGFVTGANLTFHRDIYEKVGYFDERFGAGSTFVSAEDTDYVFRASLLGFPIKYDPSFVVDHFHGRRSLAEAKSLIQGYYFGDGALYGKHLFSSLVPLKILKGAVLNAMREGLRKVTPDPIVGRHHTAKLFHNLRGMAAYMTNVDRSSRRRSMTLGLF